MEKLLSVLLSLTLLLSCLVPSGVTASADDDIIASGSCGAENYTLIWALDSNGVLSFTGEEQRMADFVNGGASRPEWYSYRQQIKKVVMNDGVINIGAYAFADCINLAEVSFGTVDTIGNNAFENCTSLTSVILPSQANWMYTAVFKNCTALKYANLGDKWWTTGTVPDWFFEGCSSLELIRLGNPYTGFEANTLSGCSSLKAVITDNTDIISAGSYTVYRTNQLSGVCSDNTYSSQLLTWNYDYNNSRLYFTGSGDMKGYENGAQPWQAFTGGVSKVDFSTTDAKTSISTTAFQGRTAITSVDFTNIYAIGWGAFAECTNLGSIQFDSMLNQIWNYAFANDEKIDQIRFTQGSDELHIYPWAFNNCSGTTFWLDLPANTRYVDDHAFWNTGFNYIKIFSENVTIGEDAFGNGEGGYSRFFGVGGKETGVHSFVNTHKDKGYNWFYFCLDDAHSYTTSTVAPTCTEEGYDLYSCPFCDAESVKSNFTPALGHSYKYRGADGLTVNYECTRCGAVNLFENALSVRSIFDSAISATAGSTKFSQANYDGRADLDCDGVINARDLVRINRILDSPALDNKETTFDVNTQYQTIDGFGASAAWWSQYVGEWENAEDILSLLYSKENGIGLNIYRYNLGAGSEDQKDYNLYVADARTHCFMQSDGTYNWNNDPNAMNCLSIARRLNPDLRVTLFANSAPYFMTKNGKTYGDLTTNSDGSTSGTENLASGKYQSFANYITTCAEHFIDEGYNVTSVSPINEPEWDWSGWYNGDGGHDSNQEGCHFTETTARSFYNLYMVPAVTGNSKLNGKVDVEIWESGQVNHNYWWSRFLAQCFSSQYSNNKNIRNYVDTVAAHSYWASTSDRETAADTLKGKYYGQKVRSTEYCQMTNDASTGVLGHIQSEGGSTNGMTIDYGLAMADIIYQDMTILNSVEWDWWTACGKGIYPDSLVYISSTNHDNIQPSKRLWCLGNYSKFIESGAKRISVSTGSEFGKNLVTAKTYNWTTDNDSGTDKNNYIEESAYLNPDGSVVIVYINNSDTIEYTTFTDNSFLSYDSYVTDKDRDLEHFASGKIGDAVCIPAKSVTTVVLKSGKTPAVSTEGAYLFTYFTGNAQSEQRIRFAVSKDGYNFSPLNGNNPIITQTLGTLNCRDPYVFKGQDGYYYIIATDMDASTNVWWGNSNTMVLWRSRDLVNWGDETVINMSEITGAPDIQRCWAPQVYWDESKQKYLVYFGLASWTISQNVTNMYYCYTDDLLDQSRYSYPQLLYKSATTFVDGSGNTVESSSIDGDIFYDSKNGTYYLYYKDEGTATICYVTSKSLTGPYGDAANPTKAVNNNVGLEGCNSHFITGTDTLVMLADAYGDGYFVMNQSNDFRNFHTLDSSSYTINNCSPRHGSVIAINDTEYDRLVSAYGV